MVMPAYAVVVSPPPALPQQQQPQQPQTIFFSWSRNTRPLTVYRKKLMANPATYSALL